MRTKLTLYQSLEELGFNLYIYRMARKLSREQVAAAIGISPATVAKAENGRWPHLPISIVYGLCQYYGLPTMAAYEFCGP
ncbi:helix-turn-helix domain-containing protein [Puia dinghuensis]|uniref:helix-turn-helix domain-containing protein n=1 Tax=Puia dinghuensis TaxID=1792502 RepID=UPI001665D00C